MATRITNNSFSLPSLLKEGTRHTQGLEEAVYRNIAACKQTSELVATCYGPYGLSKFIINSHGKLILTNDAGVILKEVAVEHPAAKILVMYTDQQKREMGDASGWVALMTGEFLTLAEGLLKIGLSASQVIDGYEVAAAKSEEILSQLCIMGDLSSVISSVIASKQLGSKTFLSDLVSNAINFVTNQEDLSEFDPDDVRVVKVMGSSLENSSVIKGMLFAREPESRIKEAKDARIVVFACPLGPSRTEAKGTVLFSNAQEMLSFNRGEEQVLESQLKAIAQTGVKVVVTGDTISDIALHYLDAMNLLVFRVQSKFDLRRLCKAIGATALARVGPPMEEEIGMATIKTIEIGADRCVLVDAVSNKEGSLATILLRGSSPNHMDSIERAINDALVSAKVFLCQDKRVVMGAGQVESELSRRLQTFASACPGVIQYAISRFADAFEAITRMLTTNAGFINKNQESMNSNSDSESVVDLYATKLSALKHSVDATLTILRVDQIIMSKPVSTNAPSPRAPAPMDAD